MLMALFKKKQVDYPPVMLPKDVSKWADGTIDAINGICQRLASGAATAPDALQGAQLLRQIEEVLKRTPEFRKLGSIEKVLNAARVSVYVADVRLDYEQLFRALYRYRQLH
ncbi:MAG: hypothetical protein Q7U16_12355 [Agitococcus sp.]|nr:hypothetical protein [Agitococcus sp.]